MKKIILFLVVFAFFGCVRPQENIEVFGKQGLVVVSENGGVILEKTWDTIMSGPIGRRQFQVPKFVLICDRDTVVWLEVPGKIYDRYNQGDTIKPL
jgi:hypothetical protein